MFISFLQKLQMSRNGVLVIALAMLLVIQVSSVGMTITCSTCGVSTCASGYCYSLVATDGYKETFCSTGACDTTMNTTVAIVNCTYDYKSDRCSTGACYQLADKQIARFMNADCTTPFYANYTCGTCTTTTGCNPNLCQTVITQNVNGGSASNSTPACIGACETAKVNTRVEPCTNGRDSLGTTKTCCMTHLGSAASVCTSQATVLGSTKFTNWATGKSSEHSITVALFSIMLLCLGLFMA